MVSELDKTIRDTLSWLRATPEEWRDQSWFERIVGLSTILQHHGMDNSVALSLVRWYEDRDIATQQGRPGESQPIERPCDCLHRCKNGDPGFHCPPSCAECERRGKHKTSCLQNANPPVEEALPNSIPVEGSEFCPVGDMRAAVARDGHLLYHSDEFGWYRTYADDPTDDMSRRALLAALAVARSDAETAKQAMADNVALLRTVRESANAQRDAALAKVARLTAERGELRGAYQGLDRALVLEQQAHEQSKAQLGELLEQEQERSIGALIARSEALRERDASDALLRDVHSRIDRLRCNNATNLLDRREIELELTLITALLATRRCA